MGLLRRWCGHCTGDWDVGGDYMVAVWGVVEGGAFNPSPGPLPKALGRGDSSCAV